MFQPQPQPRSRLRDTCGSLRQLPAAASLQCRHFKYAAAPAAALASSTPHPIALFSVIIHTHNSETARHRACVITSPRPARGPGRPRPAHPVHSGLGQPHTLTLLSHCTQHKGRFSHSVCKHTPHTARRRAAHLSICDTRHKGPQEPPEPPQASAPDDPAIVIDGAPNGQHRGHAIPLMHSQHTLDAKASSRRHNG